MFVDKVIVDVTAGKGGDGIVSFRHEKFVDRGGPNGGDGGDGGDVYVIGSNNQNTLAKYRYDKRISAEDGKNGFKQNKRGKRGADIKILLPVGTVVTSAQGEVLADLTEDGLEVLIAKGGRGGFGNAHFVSSTRQAPRFAEKGEPGQAYEATLELKMIADAGLIGLPNAGKSTLLSVLTNARPEIADYPFTTLVPNLGVADIGDERSVLFADIPGLIEGASAGKGLGVDFLRHVERTSVLVHCVDVYSEDIASAYTTIRDELKSYSAELASRPEIIVITKIEGVDQDIIEMQVSAIKKATKKKADILPISAQAHQGLRELLELVYSKVQIQRQLRQVEAEESELMPIIKPDFGDAQWQIEKLADNLYSIKGQELERFAKRTDTDNDEALARLKNILKKKGVIHELRRQKAKYGDKLVIGGTDPVEIVYE